MYVGITCRSLLAEFLRWLTERGANFGASARERARLAGLQQGEGSSVAGGLAEERQQGEGGEVVEEDWEDEVLEALVGDDSDSEDDEEVEEEAGPSSEKPKTEAKGEAQL